MRHPSSTSFDIPPTAHVPRVLGTSQDLYAPPSPPDVALEELWPKSFEVRGGARLRAWCHWRVPGAKLSYRHEAWWCPRVACWLLAVCQCVVVTNYTCCAHSLLQAPGQNMMFRNDLPYPPTSCGSLVPSTSCGSLVPSTSCGSLVPPPTSCGSLVPSTSCSSIIPPSSSGILALSASCGPGPSHPLLPNPSMMQGDVQFPPVTSSSATPPLTGQSVRTFFGSQY